MNTLQIKIKNKETYQNLMWFLKKFSHEELEILESKDSYNYAREELQHELQEIDAGNSIMVDIEELDKDLEKILLANESSDL